MTLFIGQFFKVFTPPTGSKNLNKAIHKLVINPFRGFDYRFFIMGLVLTLQSRPLASFGAESMAT
jgi:hypothetical protein